MRFEKKLLIVVAALSATLLMAGCGLSLAGDVTPPPNYIPPTTAPSDGSQGNTSGNAAQPVSAQPVFPLVPPDPSQGAAIFEQKCAPCHGSTGMGDGPQAAQLPNPPAAIGSAELAHKSKPVDWFNMVTNGNMKQFMPPFAQALSDRQRWDVIAYVFTLSAPKADVDKGKTIYDQTCAECHGPTGMGDGPKVSNLNTKPIAWARDQSKLALLSADDMAQVIASGKGEMPAYQGKLDQAQTYAVAAYIRSLSFTGAAPAEIAAAGTPGTPAAAGTAPADGATPAPGTTAQSTNIPNLVQSAVKITGQVTNGTPGGTLPGGMKATLSGYTGMTLSTTLTADVAADGSYAFKDVKVDPQMVYFVSVDANGVTYNSDILHGTDITSAEAKLPVKIYDPSTDAAGLTVDRLHVFFDFSKPGLVQVVNLYIISNPSDHVIVPPAKGKPVLSFDLPAGATNLQFQDGALGDRYVQTATGFGDTMGVAPGMGQHQILFAYNMPYTDKLALNVKSPLPVDAAIVMVPPGVNLNSGQLTDAGQQDVQGTSFHMFQANGSLKAGEALKVNLSGQPGQAAVAAAAQSSTNMNYLLIGLGAFGLVLAGAGGWLFTHRKKMQPALAAAGAGDVVDAPLEDLDETSEALLDAIVALDDLHANGNLPDAAYQERRSELKARLGDALTREKGK